MKIRKRMKKNKKKYDEIKKWTKRESQNEKKKER